MPVEAAPVEAAGEPARPVSYDPLSAVITPGHPDFDRLFDPAAQPPADLALQRLPELAGDPSRPAAEPPLAAEAAPLPELLPPEDVLRAHVAFAPAYALPGETLAATLVLRTRRPLDGLSVRLTLPEGLDYLPDSAEEASYDPSTRTLSWPKVGIDQTGLAEFPFQVQAGAVKAGTPGRDEDSATLKVIPEVQLGEAGGLRVEALAQAVVIGAAPAEAALSVEGGTLVLPGGRVTLTFAPGALAARAALRGSVFLERDAAGGPPALTFRVEPDLAFAAPVTATIDLRGLLSEALLAAGVEPALAYQRVSTRTEEAKLADGSTKTVEVRQVVYEPVPARYDAAQGVLTAQLRHFSSYTVIFQVPAGRPEPWKFAPNMGGVSPFRGSATYVQSIELPALPDGVQPSLAIVYSSAGAESGGWGDDYRMGAGWSLDVPHVRRGVRLEKRQYTTWSPQWGTLFHQYYELITNEQYKLSLGGVEYNLIYKGSANGADEFVTQHYAPVRVYRCRFGTSCNGTALPFGGFSDFGAPAPHYWQVWTADGTRYAFGTDAASTKVFRKRNGNQIAYQTWYLRYVYSPRRDDPTVAGGWSAEWVYSEEPMSGDNGMVDGQSSWEMGADWETNTRLSYIRYGNRHSSPPRAYLVMFQYTGSPARLLSIWTCRYVAGNPNNCPEDAWRLRRYELGYAGPPWNTRVARITPQAWDTGINGWRQLPNTTFEYQNENDTLVRAINNGYGGRVEFSYWQGYRNDRTYFHVNQRTLRDGLGGVTVETYEFSNPCWNDAGSPCHLGHDDVFPESRGGLMGYGTLVKRVGPQGGSPLSLVRTDTHTDRRWLGQVYDTRHYSADGGTVLRASRVWHAVNEPAPGQPAGTWLSWAAVTDEFPFGDLSYAAGNVPPSGVLMARVERRVDGLSNPTAEFQRGFWHRGGDELSTHWGYTHNWSRWIVGRVAWENRFDGLHENADIPQLRTQTLVYYDGNHGDYYAPPVRGLVTQVQRGRQGQFWVRETYGYDGQGNLTAITNPRGHTSTATYDPVTLNVLSVSNPLGHTTSYAYYGVNGVARPAGQPWGALASVTDPNLVQERYWYDVWGRVTAVVRPGDSEAHPTLSYTYSDANQAAISPPFKVEIWQREIAGCGGCVHPTFQFYDGLGRLVQTRSETVNGAQQQVVNVIYDALGREVRRFVPALEDFSWGFFRPGGWDGRPHTLTEYDLLGRVTRVVGPDGAATRTFYGQLNGVEARRRVVDALGRTKVWVSDGLGLDLSSAQGRLVRVEEYTGNFDAGTHALYAQTHYAYGWLGQLTQVTDALGHVTTINYDALGRKTGMSDPNMGSWSYAYDANGNLISQTDARGINLTFTYDALNRLTKKAVNGVDIAAYAYDATWWTSGAHPVGRRTIAQVLNGATGTNTWTRWEYDARGRVKKETRSVDGVSGTFDFQFAYDSADRVTSMTYPNGEVVTVGYDDAMRPRSLSGASVYVSNATYNALGLLTRMDHGNGTRTQRYHYGSNLEYPNAGNTSYGRLRRLCVATSSGNCDDESSAAGALLKLVYAYDAVGNIRFSGDRTTGERLAYSYDDLDRLTGVTPQVGWPGYTESYSYDAIGRMTSHSALGTFNYWHPSKPQAVTHLNSAPIAGYDANGNMVSRWDNGVWFTQEWNADNKVSRVYGNGQDIYYAYDADSTLVRKTQGGITTIYVGPHAEWNSSTGWTNYYYFPSTALGAGAGQRGLPSEGRVAMRNSGGVYWLHGDHLGSASLVTNASGGVVAQSRYTPYGSARQVSGTWPTDRRFTGQRLEGSVGLYDYNARMYSPLLARFLSPDSLVPRPDDPQSFNRYAYVLNNPLRYTDPSGHTPCPRDGGSGLCGNKRPSRPRPLAKKVSLPSPPSNGMSNTSLNDVLLDQHARSRAQWQQSPSLLNALRKTANASYELPVMAEGYLNPSTGFQIVGSFQFTSEDGAAHTFDFNSKGVAGVTVMADGIEIAFGKNGAVSSVYIQINGGMVINTAYGTVTLPSSGSVTGEAFFHPEGRVLPYMGTRYADEAVPIGSSGKVLSVNADLRLFPILRPAPKLQLSPRLTF
ncbi:MAG: RHS repeat-associated core domain-containing protein [Anaerolineae bacterium]|nr:hypothetical protein [Candidatus Roseilinea sp.]MDW8449242.1 RHS repeat-associated core domain-containing protein [Anaerolineae bacterium]